MSTRIYKNLFLISLSLLALLFASSVWAEEVTQAVSFTTRPMEGQEKTYELLVNDDVVLRYRSMVKGLTAEQRASIILERVKGMGAQLIRGPIKIGFLNGAHVITVGEKLLVTVTQSDWESNNTTGEGLAFVWANNLKTALHTATNKTIDTPLAAKENDGTGDLNTAGDRELKMLELVNEERLQAGIGALEMDYELVRIARLKSADMIENKYFDHTSPKYGDPFKMMESFGIKYKLAGENLAGDQTVEKAHESLMNSPGHRRNILKPDYTHIGIGIVEGGPYGIMFTQLFIGK